MLDLEEEFRVLYWERNELQLILPDAPNPTMILSLIRKLNERMTDITTTLGYMPCA